MKKVNEFFKSEVKNMSGSLLGIGIDDKIILDTIEKNDKITSCDLLSINQRRNKFKITGGKRKKKISIKEFRRKFKKKRIDYIIGNSMCLFLCPFRTLTFSIYKFK